MRVLALDTTTRGGSVALVEDDRLVSESEGDRARSHAERLPAEPIALLGAHGLMLADIDLFAVASGPGSFTGLRIGIATMQGFALVRQRPLVGVSALDALAQLGSRGRREGARIAAWMDAHRRDVFAALYSVSDAPLFSDERIVEREGPTVGDPAATLARWAERPHVFIGDGASMYEAVIRRDVDDADVLPPPLLAGAIGRIAARRAARADRVETIDAAGVQPLYVRRPDAEIDREKRWRSGP